MLARVAVGNIRKSIADFGIYFLTVVLGVAVLLYVAVAAIALA